MATWCRSGSHSGRELQDTMSPAISVRLCKTLARIDWEGERGGILNSGSLMQLNHGGEGSVLRTTKESSTILP